MTAELLRKFYSLDIFGSHITAVESQSYWKCGKYFKEISASLAEKKIGWFGLKIRKLLPIFLCKPFPSKN